MKKIGHYVLLLCVTSLISGTLLTVSTHCYLNNEKTIGLMQSLQTDNTSKEEIIDLLEARVEELQGALEETRSYLLSIPVKVTAYNPTEDQCDDDPLITASLTRVEDGIIALSRDLEQTLHLKFGDLVTLKTPDGETIGTFRFQDRMHKRWRRRVDIFMWERSEALNFGIKSAQMYIQRVNSEENKANDPDFPKV